MHESGHIDKLERQVAQLKAETAALRAELAAVRWQSEHAGERPHGLREGRLLSAVALLILASAVGLATFLVFRNAGMQWSNLRSFPQEIAKLEINYGLLTCAALVVAALFLYAARRWLSFFAMALVSLYVTYALFFAHMPTDIALTGRQYYGIVLGALTAYYLVCATACVRESRRHGRKGRAAALLALVNSVAFFLLAGSIVRAHLASFQVAFLAVFSCVLAAIAAITESYGPRRNYLFHLHVALSVVSFTFLLTWLVPREWLWFSIACASFLLACVYGVTGIVLLKALNLALLAMVCVGAVLEVPSVTSVHLAGHEVTNVWFLGAAIPGMLFITAWFYRRFASRRTPEDRRVSGHWFLADTFLDVPSATAAMLHAATAALVLAVFTIVNHGEEPSLPYVLALEALAVAGTGLLLRVPQFEAAAVMLLVTAHVSFYFFQSIRLEGFADSRFFLPMASGLVVLTYASGYRWEQYLARIPEDRKWEHEVVASVPSVMAVGMLLVLMHAQLGPAAGPTSQAALGAALVLAAVFAGHVPSLLAGTAAVSWAITAHAWMALQTRASGATPVAIALLLLALVFAAEYYLRITEQRRIAMRSGAELARTLLILSAAFSMSVCIHAWVREDIRTGVWLGVAGLFAIGGLVFRDNRYRWTGLLILLAALARAYREDALAVRGAALYQHLAVGLLVAFLLAFAWVQRLRLRRLKRHSGTKVPRNG